MNTPQESDLSAYTGCGPTTVAVPSLTGKTQAEAESAIISAGLVVGTITNSCDTSIPSGKVISQTPTAGSSVSPGSAVNLNISTGHCPVSVPSVVGLTLAAAQSEIMNAGFTVTNADAFSHTVSAGKVCGQSPASRVSAAFGSEVIIYISIGPTIYVSGGLTGSNSQGTGSQDRPYETVAKAMDIASNGDTIIILSGNYPENITIRKRVTIKTQNGTARIGTD